MAGSANCARRLIGFRALTPRGHERLRPQSLHEFPGVDLQRCREPQNVDETEVPFASFDLADVGPVEFGTFGEFLLRQPERDPTFAHSCAEHLWG